MTLDEAIKHAEEVADICEYEANTYDINDPYERQVGEEEGKCASKHRQLAEWLKDYKRLLEQEIKWIPVSERLPEIGEKVFLTIRMHHDHSLATVKGALKEKGVWGIVDEIIFIYELAFYDYDVIAWMPQFERPEPYREESEGEE